MAIPDFKTLMLPTLRLLADSEAWPRGAVRDRCANELGLTEEERAETLPSGGLRFDNRLWWAHTHLTQAGLTGRLRRGFVQKTDRGRQVLATNPDHIAVKLLEQFEEYRDFRNRSGTVRKANEDCSTEHSLPGPPIETIEAAVRENEQDLASQLLQRILDHEPAFFERAVLALLSAMGYGGRTGAVEHVGRSGDGGIDGIIRQDPLGLDRVYIQAKRYAPDHPVGRPDLHAFVGALHGVQADRGVFLTTSRFSKEASEYVSRIPNRIVLIDGVRLTELMVLHNVGVQDERTFALKGIDEDFGMQELRPIRHDHPAACRCASSDPSKRLASASLRIAACSSVSGSQNPTASSSCSDSRTVSASGSPYVLMGSSSAARASASFSTAAALCSAASGSQADIETPSCPAARRTRSAISLLRETETLRVAMHPRYRCSGRWRCRSRAAVDDGPSALDSHQTAPEVSSRSRQRGGIA